MQGIYRIRNILDDKRYIGSTGNLEEAWGHRQWALRNNRFYNIHLQRAWNKYGEDSFVFEVIEEIGGNNEVLIAHEQIYLNEGFKLGILYNIAQKAGGGNLGPEVNQKRSKAIRGRKLTQEHKNNISEGKKGEKRSQEYRDNLSKMNYAEGNPFYGECHTEETKQKMSEIRKGWYRTHKHPRKGEHTTEKTRRKLSVAMAKPYPAFYNEKTNEYIPPGRNLSKICREHGLRQDVMWLVSKGITYQTKAGWRLATEKEETAK